MAANANAVNVFELNMRHLLCDPLWLAGLKLRDF
jgi:hypothetical protein